MSLRRKSKKERKPSTYEREHPIFVETANRYNGTISNAKEKAETAAKKIALVENETQLDQLVTGLKVVDDYSSIKLMRAKDRTYIINNKPNYFLTLSMKPCFDNRWWNYAREFQVAKLHKRAAVLLYKLFIELDPKLKSIPYAEWPFFFATIEHFDEVGNLVAPHLHILFRHDADIERITEIVKRLWKQAVEDAGESGVDLQSIAEEDIFKRASYILKDSHQDGLGELENGVLPHKICQRYGWSQDAVAHDKWRLNRDTFHAARNARHPILRHGDPSGKVDRALRKIFRDIDDAEIAAKKEYFQKNRHKAKKSINNNEPTFNGSMNIEERING